MAILGHFMLYSQSTSYPQDFRSPVDYSYSLAGNFGELRNNHFHSGIDIRTNGAMRKHLYAIGDGYVSRIKVSPYGYGKALYITHYNGYVSVYGHLDGFNDSIGSWVTNKQHELKSFAFDCYLPKDLIKIKKSELIAYTGNSGSSGGPHLHFEIRDEKTEFPINPFLFGMPLTDNISPRIYGIAIYPMHPKSWVNQKNTMKKIPAYGSYGKYKLSSKSSITVHGDIVFGISMNDFINNSNYRQGVYTVKLKIDSTLIYSHRMEKFSFYQYRAINSYIDYADYKKTKSRRIHRSYVEPYNNLCIYDSVVNRGVYRFNDDTTHTVSYIIADVHGNQSTLNFKVQSSSQKIDFPEPDKYNCKKIMPYGQINSFVQEDIHLVFPDSAFYDTVFFNFERLDTMTNGYTPVYKIHSPQVPVHKYFNLSIKIDTNSIQTDLLTKLLVVNISPSGRIYAEGGTYNAGFIHTKVRDFGKYTVLIDTIPPQIVPLNIYNNKNMSNYKSMSFKITDNLSGIKVYDGYIDDKWVVFDYDAKRNKITHTFNKKQISTNKKHSLKLIVKDERGNEKIYEATFFK